MLWPAPPPLTPCGVSLRRASFSAPVEHELANPADQLADTLVQVLSALIGFCGAPRLRRAVTRAGGLIYAKPASVPPPGPSGLYGLLRVAPGVHWCS